MAATVILADVPADVYHDDRFADTPTLSATLAKVLCSASPAHARAQHPRLNPEYQRDEDAKYDIGTAVHLVLLEGTAERIDLVFYDDWRKKEAREQRDEARDQGMVPLLEKDFARVQAMVESARYKIDAYQAAPPLLADGKPEVTIVVEVDGVLCRVRVDWLRDDFRAIDDVKTTGRIAGANPDGIDRHLFAMGYDVQAALYRRAVKAATGVEPDFRFIFVETEPPYEVGVVGLSPDAWALADDRVSFALRTWRDCLETGVWPGYRREVAYVEPPGWLESQWIAKTWNEREAA